MKTRAPFLPVLVVIVLALLLPSSNFAVSAQDGAEGGDLSITPEGVVVKTYAFPDGKEPFARPTGTEAVPWTDISVHGTMWRPENSAQFAMYKPYGWGIATKVKAIGNQWVHIPIPYITYLEDVGQKVRYVQFCAQSSAGAATRPTALHLWTGNTRFYAGAVAWPANNNLNCWGVTFSPGVWRADLGVSVLLYYANITHTITLYKAWAQFER